MGAIKTYKDLITGKALEKVDRAISTAQTIDSAKRQAFKEGLKKDRDMIRRGVRDNGLAKLRIDNAKNTIFNELQNNSQILNALSDTRNIVAKQTRNARVATGVGAGALALGAGAYGLKKLRDKKKQEKTAYDIVDDRFEKIADVVNFNEIRQSKAVKSSKPGSTKDVMNILKTRLANGEITPHKFLDEMSGVLGTPTSKNKTGGTVIQFPGNNKKTSLAKKTALTSAGALALGTGAYGLKKLHDKKKQEKTAYDIINDRFEKIAGLSNVLSGKNVVRAINDVKAGKNVINTFKGNLKYLEPSARKATREAIGTMTKDLSTLKGRVGKEIAKTTGTYGLGAGLLAGGVHSFRKAKNKNEDK